MNPSDVVKTMSNEELATEMAMVQAWTVKTKGEVPLPPGVAQRFEAVRDELAERFQIGLDSGNYAGSFITSCSDERS